MEKALRLYDELTENRYVQGKVDVGHIEEMIITGGWDKLTKVTKNMDATIVREFYLNATIKRVQKDVMVRGKVVSFSIEAINNYYSIMLSEIEKFLKYLE